MDTQIFVERMLLLLKQNLLVVSLICVGTILFGYGLYMSFSGDKEDGVVIEQASSEGKTSQDTLVIDVEGAVNKPGVYELKRDARVQDALIAAGGLSLDANREMIAQTINLAGKLTDGAKLYFPFEGDTVTSSTGITSTAGTVQGTASSLVNINTASTSELDALRGIGEVTAKKIIDNRPYTSVEELLHNKILKSNVYEDLKDTLTVY